LLINASKRLNNIPNILGINADKLGIKAKDMAFKKLISIYPVYFMINSTIDVNIDITKNVVKIKFFIF
jgi:hypothetical protein